jgi:threonyl-tRNA synthetase
MNEARVAVRKQGKGDDGTVSIEEFIARAVQEIKSRGLETQN